ncbi:MAG: hypothetical protein ABI963_01680 [Rhizomicrobium sp.]
MTSQRVAGTLHLIKAENDMPSEIEIGQTWSIWVPGRRQWLLATVVRRDNGEAVLKFDPRYGAGPGYDEQRADETTMLTAPNLFRFVEAK